MRQSHYTEGSKEPRVTANRDAKRVRTERKVVIQMQQMNLEG